MRRLLLLLLLVACGNKREPGSIIGACDERATIGRCGEYYGEFYEGMDLCPNGELIKECPKEGAVLRCAHAVGKRDEYHALTYPPKRTKAQAEEVCKPPRQMRAP